MGRSRKERIRSNEGPEVRKRWVDELINGAAVRESGQKPAAAPRPESSEASSRCWSIRGKASGGATSRKRGSLQQVLAYPENVRTMLKPM